MNAYLRVVEALRANGSRVSERGDGRAQAQCPAHDDHNPSLSIWPRDDGKGSQVKCHAQCDLPAVLAALGLTFRDLFDDAEMRDALRGNADYRYPGGRVNRRRTGPDGRKRFTQTGAQDKSLFFADKIPHGCPLVYLTEGEKGAKAIWAMGGVAVATGGAMRSCDPTPLRDTLVKVVVDRDAAGLRWAERQSKALAGIAQRVCFVRTPLNIPRADVVEHIAAGLPLEQLEDFDPSTATYDCGESPGEVPAKSRGELPDEPADRIDRVADFCGPRLIVDVPDDEIDAEKPKVWNAKDLEPAAPPRWLAANRLPRAAVSLLIGDEGIGKSLLWVLIVAHITTGKPLPGFGIPARDPGRVMLVITEDDWSTAVLPRLKVAGADLDMIRVICVERDGSGAPIFPRDMGLVRNADPRPDLVVVDCWLDTVPPELSVKDSQQARLALHPWKDLATTTDAAIWLLGHSNRFSGGSVRDRYGATYVLRQKARMTIWAMQDEDGALLAGPEKANGAVTTVASRFVIKPILHFEPSDEHDGTVPLLEYDRISHLTIREHVEDAAAAQVAAADRTDASPIAWLAVQLGGGPRWSTDIDAAAERDGISAYKLRAAKLKLNVKPSRESGTGPWFLCLPQHLGRTPVENDFQMRSDAPVFHRPTSGESGKNQMPASTSEDFRSRSEGYMETVSTSDFCACGEQLTSPASIRYGMCRECRLAAANPDEGR